MSLMVTPSWSRCSRHEDSSTSLVLRWEHCLFWPFERLQQVTRGPEQYVVYVYCCRPLVPFVNHVVLKPDALVKWLI